MKPISLKPINFQNFLILKPKITTMIQRLSKPLESIFLANPGEAKQKIYGIIQTLEEVTADSKDSALITTHVMPIINFFRTMVVHFDSKHAADILSLIDEINSSLDYHSSLITPTTFIINQISSKYEQAMYCFTLFYKNYDREVLKTIGDMAYKIIDIFNNFNSTQVQVQVQVLETELAIICVNLVAQILRIISEFLQPGIIFTEKLQYIDNLIQLLTAVIKQVKLPQFSEAQCFQILTLIFGIYNQAKIFDKTTLLKSIFLSIAPPFMTKAFKGNLELIKIIEGINFKLSGELKEEKYTSSIPQQIILPLIPQIEKIYEAMVSRIKLQQEKDKQTMSRIQQYSALKLESQFPEVKNTCRELSKPTEYVSVDSVVPILSFSIQSFGHLLSQAISPSDQLAIDIIVAVDQICLLFDNHPQLFALWLHLKYQLVSAHLDHENGYQQLFMPINEILLLPPKQIENGCHKVEILTRLISRYFEKLKKLKPEENHLRSVFFEIIFNSATEILTLYEWIHKNFDSIEVDMGFKSELYYQVIEKIMNVCSICFIELGKSLTNLDSTRIENLMCRLILIAAVHKQMQMKELQYINLLDIVIKFLDKNLENSDWLKILFFEIGQKLRISSLSTKIQIYQVLLGSYQGRFSKQPAQKVAERKIEPTESNYSIDVLETVPKEVKELQKLETSENKNTFVPEKNEDKTDPQPKLVNNTTIDRLTKKIEGLKQSNRETQQALVKKDAEVNGLQRKLQTKSQEKTELKAQHAKIVSSHQNEKAQLAKEIERLKKRIAKNYKKILKLGALDQNQKKQLAELQSTLQEEKATIQKGNQEIQRLEGSLEENTTTQRQLAEEHKQTIDQMGAQIAELQAAVQEGKAIIEKSAQEIQELKVSLEEQETQKLELKDQYALEREAHKNTFRRALDEMTEVQREAKHSNHQLQCATTTIGDLLTIIHGYQQICGIFPSAPASPSVVSGASFNFAPSILETASTESTETYVVRPG